LKIGDLIRVRTCPNYGFDCGCFFCHYNSSGIGIVITDEIDDTLGEPPEIGWIVHFDCGQWEIFSSDIKKGAVEVISEAG